MLRDVRYWPKRAVRLSIAPHPARNCRPSQRAAGDRKRTFPDGLPRLVPDQHIMAVMLVVDTKFIY